MHRNPSDTFCAAHKFLARTNTTIFAYVKEALPGKIHPKARHEIWLKHTSHEIPTRPPRTCVPHVQERVAKSYEPYGPGFGGSSFIL